MITALLLVIVALLCAIIWQMRECQVATARILLLASNAVIKAIRDSHEKTDEVIDRERRRDEFAAFDEQNGR